MTWNLREEIIVAILRDQGHNLRHDYQEGWTRCGLCAGGWNVRKRARVASGDEPDDGGWSRPLQVRTCG